MFSWPADIMSLLSFAPESIFTDRISEGGNAIAFVRPSVRPLVSSVSSKPTAVDLELLRVRS